MLSAATVVRWAGRLDALHERIAPHFARPQRVSGQSQLAALPSLMAAVAAAGPALRRALEHRAVEDNRRRVAVPSPRWGRVSGRRPTCGPSMRRATTRTTAPMAAEREAAGAYSSCRVRDGERPWCCDARQQPRPRSQSHGRVSPRRASVPTSRGACHSPGSRDPWPAGAPRYRHSLPARDCRAFRARARLLLAR